MKKPLLSILLMSSIGAFGQAPSLTSANILSVGNSQTFYIADSNAVALDAVTGANVTWDYSGLRGYGTTLDQNILAASGTAQASNFPSSTIADELEGNLMIYSNAVADSSFAQGYFFNEATLGDVIATFGNDEMKLMQYPFTYGDQIIDTHDGTMSVPGFAPIPFPYSGSVEVTADGYGTLILGGNTYNDVLRVKTVENSLAQTGIAGDITLIRTQYLYYQPSSQNFPLFMHITLDVGGAAASVVYSKDMLPPLSIDDLSTAAKVKIYPNPVEDDMNIAISSTEAFNGTISIRNILGQEVFNTSTQVNVGENRVQLDAANLKAGIYLVSLESGKSKITKKITVQ